MPHQKKLKNLLSFYLDSVINDTVDYLKHTFLISVDIVVFSYSFSKVKN